MDEKVTAVTAQQALATEIIELVKDLFLRSSKRVGLSTIYSDPFGRFVIAVKINSKREVRLEGSIKVESKTFALLVSGYGYLESVGFLPIVEFYERVVDLCDLLTTVQAVVDGEVSASRGSPIVIDIPRGKIRFFLEEERFICETEDLRGNKPQGYSVPLGTFSEEAMIWFLVDVQMPNLNIYIGSGALLPCGCSTTG